MKAFSIALIAALVSFSASDADPLVKVQAPVQSLEANGTKQAARKLIEDALSISHTAEIYADLRSNIKDVYIPLLKDAVQGDLPGSPAPDAKTASMMAKVLTFLDYSRKAGDDVDAALVENKKAMIAEAADIVADYAAPSEIDDLRGILGLPAVRKTFDALLAASKLITGFSYQDSRSFAEFSAWVGKQNLDFANAIPGSPGSAASPPGPKRISKAQALVNDLVRVSHIDDAVDRVKHFMREVYAETVPLSDEDRQDLRDQIDQFEFTYNLQKSIGLAAAPSVVAAALSDEQLATLHNFIRSPACAKAFDLIFSVVKAATAFTKDDIASGQQAFLDLDKKAKARERSQEDTAKIEAAWNAFTEKWSKILRDRIAPDTRSGLEKSWEDLQTSDPPI